jgi:predicted amidohydrolase
MNRIKTIVRAAGIAGAGGESSAGKSLPAINPDPMMKMKTIMILLFAAGIGSPASAGNKTDASLFMKSDSSVYQTEIRSQSGDLYESIGHHGPAVENEWMALRIYFDRKCAIDVYNKARPGIELKTTRWYPDAAQQQAGSGADYYKVGNTVGLGGVRLWDGKQVVMLDPVSMRTARVSRNSDSSVMEMTSAGVPYMDRKVDILVRVTVRSGVRFADVEAEALSGGPVRFVTGINRHPGLEILRKEGRIATWGTHPEDVAAQQVAVGAALVYQPEDFAEPQDDGSSILLISKPTAKISTKIISACAREPELNTMDKFVRYIDSHKMLPGRANIPGNPQSRKRPESLRVAIAEMVGKLDSTQENMAEACRLAEEAGKKKARLVLFPEGILTGNAFRVDKQAVMPAEPGRFAALQQIADKYDMTISIGFALPFGDKINMAQAIIRPGLAMLFQHKAAKAETEPGFLAPWPDPRREVFEVDGFKVVTMICSEFGFDHVVAAMNAENPDFVLHPSAGSSTEKELIGDPPSEAALAEAGKSFKVPPTRAAADAMKRKTPRAAANPIGFDGETYWPGNSYAVGADGKVYLWVKGCAVPSQMRPSVNVADVPMPPR